MKPYLLFSAAALATVLMAAQATAQSVQDPAPPTQTTTPSGPIAPNQKRSTFDRNDEMRAAEQQRKVEGARAATPATPMTDPAYAVAIASAEPALVTNGPVLDTAENRAKYPPQSRAGKRTAAVGN
ncbi:hypothetical protein [Caulobacter sp. NIBR1757]|uniref:hypothetical protein n=1 Tax=Caulobacter sp. NIBR1757 TaxID=3016000 RepID=UPI0022EFF310|nr:hypothetical protein [Caulobacter sp. NIBR1757]WGM40093.1 hypothetical protein AMEJIAPC_03034 [Caulobacter sp. NIBR1757]